MARFFLVLFWICDSVWGRVLSGWFCVCRKACGIALFTRPLKGPLGKGYHLFCITAIELEWSF